VVVVVVVVVVGVVVVVTVVVGGLGLEVVDVMVAGALGGGRLGSFDEVGVGALLGEAVDVEIRTGLSVAPTIPLPSSAAGLALVSVVVGPATPAPGSAVYGTAPTGPTVVLEGEVRSAPVSSSQLCPQGSLWLTSAKAPMKSRTAMIDIAETRTTRRSHQRRLGRGTACPNLRGPVPGLGFISRPWTS
jgi:hypothetical protein